jgi:hypothetical protein
MKYNITKILALILSSVAITGGLRAAPPTAAEVGDVDSFGHNAQYMGAKSGFITLSPACTPAPTPVPPGTANDDQCFNLAAAPAQTNFDAEDILRIKLPKKATRTIIYPALNFFLNYQLQNTTGVFQSQGVFAFTASVTIESDVLLNPSIIDPQTGLPANGKLVGQFSYVYRDDRSMDVNARQRLRETLVRVGNAGISKSGLIGQGLSEDVVDDLFKSSMTIRMSVTGSAKLVTDASITCNMRLFGD